MKPMNVDKHQSPHDINNLISLQFSIAQLKYFMFYENLLFIFTSVFIENFLQLNILGCLNSRVNRQQTIKVLFCNVFRKFSFLVRGDLMRPAPDHPPSLLHTRFVAARSEV